MMVEVSFRCEKGASGRAEEEDEALVSLDTILEDSVREMFDLVSGSKVVSTLSTKFICNARAVQCCF